MRASILAALFPQWRDRDARLCREIVARGICEDTSELGFAVRACLVRIDAVTIERNRSQDQLHDALRERDAAKRAAVAVGSREKDRARIADLEEQRDATHADNQRLGSELAGRGIIIADLRARLDAAERSDAASALATLAECAWRLGVPRERLLATVCEVRDRATALRGVERDLARVANERDEARGELAALRERVKDVAARMAVEVQEVSNG